MEDRGPDISHIVFRSPAGPSSACAHRVLTATQGEAIMHHTLPAEFVPVSGERMERKGVMIATETGQVTAYAVENLHDRGVLFVKPGDKVYGGPGRGRAQPPERPAGERRARQEARQHALANKEATVTLKAPRQMLSLEQAIEYIGDDELVEITPTQVRVRKRILDEGPT